MEYVKELYATGDIDAGRFNTAVAYLLAAKTETELGAVVRSLPPPVRLTSTDRRLAKPLEIHAGTRAAAPRRAVATGQANARQRGPGQHNDRPHRSRVRRVPHRPACLQRMGQHHDHRSPGCRGPDHPAPRRGRHAAGTAGARAPAHPARRDHEYRQSPPPPPGSPGPQETPARLRQALTMRTARSDSLSGRTHPRRLGAPRPRCPPSLWTLSAIHTALTGHELWCGRHHGFARRGWQALRAVPAAFPSASWACVA